MLELLAALKAHARLLRHRASPPSWATDAGEVIVPLGATKVRLRTRESRPGGLTYLNLHENEQTSVQAARELLQANPGRLVELRAAGERLVSFRIGLAAHTLDPNRIFTDTGLAATLHTLGPDSPAARRAATRLREAVLAALPAPGPGPIVALHNNSGRDYSIENYAAGAKRAGDAAARHVGDAASPHDFFIVTEQRLFKPLAADGFNVVLQSPGCEDDGSLSVWAQRAGRAYVNVEALDGHLAEQQRMLDAVHRHFS